MAKTKKIPPSLNIGIWPFSVTIFWGAFLLFLVQPLIGKYILPWFGGAPGVWTTCLLFFQCLLLGGYSYAHCLNFFLSIRKQAIVHAVFLALVGGLLLVIASLMLLRVQPIEWLRPEAGTEANNPTLSILMVLLLSIGLPYFVLSATGPLIQAWFAKTCSGKSPYRLYALSNFGSLLALVGFPFLVEPLISRTTQVHIWAGGVVVYALVCGYLAWSLRSVSEIESTKKQGETKKPVSLMRQFSIWFFWLALPACGTSLLMATTNKMCQDIAVVPLLWVLPLALYLVTFMISFDNPRWYVREIYTPLLIVCWVGVLWVLKDDGEDVLLMWQVVLFCLALFVSCMVCHGELYRLRPESVRLTQYYIGISTGGALGGIFVALLAPIIFTGYWEYHISLWIGGFLLLLVQILHGSTWMLGKLQVRYALVVCWGAVCLTMFKYTSFFGWSERIAIIFFPMLAGWWTISVLLKHWRKNWQTTILMEIKLAFVGMILALAILLLGIGLTGVAFAEAWKELTPGLWVAMALLFLNLFVWQRVQCWKGLKIGRSWCVLLLIPSLIMLGFGLIKQATESQRGAFYADRNFFGTIKISQYTDRSGSPYRLLQDGKSWHGYQYEELEICNRITTYYSEDSGAGLAIRLTPKFNKRVGVVGMGVGTMAGYANDGDFYQFYEINPLVKKLSSEVEKKFTFRMNAVARGATVDVELGDARLTMEQELRRGERKNYDILILDAFSSASIPVHLLTKESMELYGKHMNPEGVIAIHISTYLNLEPVVRRLAKETDYPMVVTKLEWDDEESYTINGKDWVYACTWILLTRNERMIKELKDLGHVRSDLNQQEDFPLWTDDYVSIFGLMKKPAWWPNWLGGDSS